MPTASSRRWRRSTSDRSGDREVLEVAAHLVEVGAADLWPVAEQVLALDEVFCPRTGATHTAHAHFDFAADRVIAEVKRLREMSPLWEMVQEGIDLSQVKWTAH